jgi:hypothetical protein
VSEFFPSSGLVAFAGPYGTGKTEVAINYAVAARKAGLQVSLVDLDIVTPYFRVGDHRTRIQELGVEVIAAPGALASFETPSLSPEIAGVISDPNRFVVLDVGGDPAGARLLGVYQEQPKARGYEYWLVVNPYRPESSTSELVCQQRQNIEQQSGLKFTGCVANPNLGPVTTLETVQAGYQQVVLHAQALALPLVLLTVVAPLVDQLHDLRVVVLPLRLFSVLPWEDKLGGGR